MECCAKKRPGFWRSIQKPYGAGTCRHLEVDLRLSQIGWNWWPLASPRMMPAYHDFQPFWEAGRGFLWRTIIWYNFAKGGRLDKKDIRTSFLAIDMKVYISLTWHKKHHLCLIAQRWSLHDLTFFPIILVSFIANCSKCTQWLDGKDLNVSHIQLLLQTHFASYKLMP